MTTHWQAGDSCIWISREEYPGSRVRLLTDVVEVNEARATIKLRTTHAVRRVSVRTLRRLQPCPTCKRTADVYKLAHGVYMCASCGQTIRRRGARMAE